MMYNPAFDPFNGIYRMLNILRHFGVGEIIEVDRLRIYDFYLLFPYKTYKIRFKRTEENFRKRLTQYVEKKENPYNISSNDRRLFERLRPYQMIALSHLASYGLISPSQLLEYRVKIIDYGKMQQKSAYLSSKILTMFLERPIIFLGYGINDADVKQILESISACLENDQLDKLKERLIFVEWNNNPDKPDEISERKLDSNNGKTLSMKNVLLTDYSELYTAILQNKARYDVKVLRRVKSQLYELVKENKPKDKLYIATDIDDDSSKVDFVVGIGVYGRFGDVGYRGIKAEEVFRYVIGQSKRELNGDMILKEAFPALKRRGSLPIFKLIAECKSLDSISKTADETFKKRNKIEAFINKADRKWIKRHNYLECASIIEYYKKYGLNKTCMDIPKMDLEKIDPDDLKAFILLALSEKPEVLSVDVSTCSYRSVYKKCICIWDFLKYHDNAVKHIEDLRNQKNN